MAGGTYTGEGTSVNPYIVEDVADFQAVCDLQQDSTYVKLSGDLDFSSLGTITTSLNSNKIIDFNGMNFKVKNLTFSNSTLEFGFITTSSALTFRNVVFENINVTCLRGGFIKHGSSNSNSYPGVIVNNVHVRNSVARSTDDFGLLSFAQYSYGRIQYCSMDSVDIISGGNVGLVPYGGFSTIRDCYARNCRFRARSRLGFLADKNWTSSPTIENCYMHGEFYFSTESGTIQLGGDNGDSGSYNSKINNCAVIPTKVGVHANFDNSTSSKVEIFGGAGITNCFYVPAPIVVGDFNG